jgi:hypothetical protein
MASVQSVAMHDMPALAPPARPALRRPERASLGSAHPSLPELFRFMAEAELRFESLRLRIVDRRTTVTGQEVETHEIWLRHPGQAKVVSGQGDATGRDFTVWITDGEVVRTYDARDATATVRRLPNAPVGSTDPDLPPFARLYVPVTALPPESLADAFIHPNGMCRNVLATGNVRLLGTAALAGDREVLLLRSDHPRTSHVLTDRPDHWLEVGVDRQTGLILLLAEHVGDQMTRHAEAVSVGIDEPIGDEAFRLHISNDTRVLY